MELTIFGATGATGTSLTEQALAAGHQVTAVVRDPARLGEVADEMADVALYLLALCNTLDIDLSDAITNKLAKTALKYPIERCRGRYKPQP